MPNEFAEQLKERTMRFALHVLRLCRTLPGDWEGRFVADQLFRSSARTSANYHAACRARSRRDFINKLGMVLEESDESVLAGFRGPIRNERIGRSERATGRRAGVAGDLHAISEDRQPEQSSIDQEIKFAFSNLQFAII